MQKELQQEIDNLRSVKARWTSAREQIADQTAANLEEAKRQYDELVARIQREQALSFGHCDALIQGVTSTLLAMKQVDTEPVAKLTPKPVVAEPEKEAKKAAVAD